MAVGKPLFTAATKRYSFVSEPHPARTSLKETYL
jgi:hypothetical protein